MKTIKKVISGTLGLGRATATVVGLAVALALLLGVSTAALAAIPGDPFELGEANLIRSTTALVASVGGPALVVENDQSNRAATALSLEMANPNLAPMRVNATGRVANLNADALDGRDSASFADGTGGKANNSDRLDGKDSGQFLASSGKAADADRLDGMNSSSFWTGEVYNLSSSPVTGTPFAETFGGAGACDSGDVAINGNYRFLGSTGDHEIVREQLFSDDYVVSWSNGPVADTLEANVTCADFPPLR